jgi:hypothetical protein
VLPHSAPWVTRTALRARSFNNQQRPRDLESRRGGQGSLYLYQTNQETTLNGEQFTSEFYKTFALDKAIHVPENLRANIEDTVSKVRKSYDHVAAQAKETMKAWEEIVAATQEGAKTLNDKVINDAHTNAEALFDVAHKLARAKTMPEAMQAQSAFVQRQLKAANTQSKELFELST